MRFAAYRLHVIPYAPFMLRPRHSVESARLHWLPRFDHILDLLAGQKLQTASLLEGNAPLELYLQFRPERYTDIEQLASSGQFALSPWYVSPNFESHDTETTIRNLQLGMGIAAALGQRVRAGFVPPGKRSLPQLPQVLANTGFTGLLMPHHRQHFTEELWVAPDGSKLVIGYAPQLETDIADLRARLEALANTRNLALLFHLQGNDYANSLSATLKNARAQLIDDIFQSTPQAYLGAIAESQGSELQTVASDQETTVTEDALFQKLGRIEAALANAAFGDTAPLQRPQQALAHAWRQALLNAPNAQDAVNALLTLLQASSAPTLVQSDNPAFKLTALKLPDNGDGGLIVRGENTSSDSQWVTLTTKRRFEQAHVTNVLEQPLGGLLPLENGHTLRFQAGARRILTFHLKDAQEASARPT